MTTYAILESALAQLHGADADTQRGALRGRLKHLQRLGLPLGEKAGKGRRVDYSRGQIIQLALALQMAETGIDPAIIVQIVGEIFRGDAGDVLCSLPAKRADAAATLFLHAHFMSWDWGGQADPSRSWCLIKPSAILKFKRGVFFDLDTLVQELDRTISITEKAIPSQ